MSLNANPMFEVEPGVFYQTIRVQGAGAAAPVKTAADEFAAGITITRTGAGVYRFTFKDAQGQFAGFTWGLQATTPGNVKGHTVTAGAYDATNKRIDLSLWDSSFAADDLQTAEWLCLTFKFKRTKAKG